MASGLGAGLGADMLQDILRRKLEEQRIMQVAKEAEARRLQEAVQHKDTIGIQNRRIDQDASELGFRQQRAGVDDQRYAEGADDRTATVKFKNAQIASMEGAPSRDAATAAARAAEAQAGREFTAKENAANRANAIKIAGMRIAGSQSPQPSTIPSQQNEVDDAIALIKQLRDDPARATSTGPFEGRGLGAFENVEGYTRFKALHDNLVNKLALAQAGKLKGQGQISNFEREMMQKAATALSRSLSDQDYLNELGKVEQQFQRMKGGVPAAGPAPGQKAAETPEQRLARLLGGG